MADGDKTPRYSNSSDTLIVRRWMVGLFCTVVITSTTQIATGIWWAATLTETVNQNAEKIEINRDRIRWLERNRPTSALTEWDLLLGERLVPTRRVN